jgi:hypothetical protein
MGLLMWSQNQQRSATVDTGVPEVVSPSQPPVVVESEPAASEQNGMTK